MTKNRDLLRVAAARFISRAGGEAAFFIGIWGKAAYDLQATPSQLALLMGALSLTSIAGTVVSGVLVDRFDARRVLLVAECFFVPIALAFIFPTSLMQMLVLVSLLGLFGAPVMTAAASISPFLVDEETPLSTVNAWIEGAGAVSFVVGPAVGYLLVTYVGMNAIWWFDALTSLVGAALIWGVHISVTKDPEREKRHAFAELREGVAYTYSHRALRYPVLLGTAVWLAFGSFTTLEPLFFRDVVHTTAGTVGLMQALFGIGMVFGAWAFTRLPARFNSARGLMWAVCLVGLGTLAYVGTPVLGIISVGAVVWGTFVGVAEVLLRTRIQSASPDELVGRIAGTTSVHRQAGELVPLAISPLLAAAFGVQAVLIAGGLVIALLVPLTYREAAAVDRIPALRDVRPEPLAAVEDDPISPTT